MLAALCSECVLYRAWCCWALWGTCWRFVCWRTGQTLLFEELIRASIFVFPLLPHFNLIACTTGSFLESWFNPGFDRPSWYSVWVFSTDSRGMSVQCWFLLFGMSVLCWFLWEFSCLGRFFSFLARCSVLDFHTSRDGFPSFGNLFCSFRNVLIHRFYLAFWGFCTECCLFAVGLLASSSAYDRCRIGVTGLSPFVIAAISLFGVSVMCGNSRVSCACFFKRVLCYSSRGFCALLSMGFVLLLSRGVFAWFPIEHVSRCLLGAFNFVTFFVFGVVVFLGFCFCWVVRSFLFLKGSLGHVRGLVLAFWGAMCGVNSFWVSFKWHFARWSCRSSARWSEQLTL